MKFYNLITPELNKFMKILLRESENENYDAKLIVKQIKQAIDRDFDVDLYKVYYNPSSIKIMYDHPVDFLTEEEYDAARKYDSSDFTRLRVAIENKLSDYLSKLPIPDGAIKEARINWGYHGLFQIVVRRTLPVDKKAVRTESFQPFETYSINDIVEARSRVDSDWEWEELMDEAEVNEDYALIAVVELDAIKRFLSISDNDVKDLSVNEDGDYIRLRLKSGETRYFYERGNQLKDKNTGKLIPIKM